MKIIFSGTPEFSLPALEYIHKNHKLLAVITKPDKPLGRGLKLAPPPVKKYALNNHIKYFQPVILNDPIFINNIQSLQPDFIIDVSYGKILPEELINLPLKACINVHPALLPGYKGPCPIQWVIINGENFTGVSSHLMTIKIDAGKIIHQEKLNFSRDITYETLYQQLSLLSIKVIKISLEKFLKNDFLENPADAYKIKNFYARKLIKEDFLIDWSKNSLSINNLIKGTKNKPTAYTLYNNTPIKIYTSEIADDFKPQNSFQPGEIVNADRKNGIIIKTGDGFLKIIELQKQNKKILNYNDFLNGTKLHITEKFQNA